ncbi:MAG: hypothetical protein Q8K99_06180 [Actinomycetota bacterium]|nr:hypothetical protein [Actinomycetota bacterium]
MKMRRTTILVVAALALGLLAGNAMIGVAAPASDPTATVAATGWIGMGLRLGAAMRDAGGRLSDVVARLTGNEVDDVIAKRTAGESFADIAAEAGVGSDAVVDEALKVRADLLSERVKDGTITQDQADAALAQMETRLTERVESTDEACGAGGGFGRGGGRGAGGRGAGGGMGMGAAGGCGGACVQAPAATQ